MTQDSKERAYEPDEIEARLNRELPHWRYENGWIRRTFRTASWKGTLMVINAVGHLAEAAWHHPDIAASYAWVEVKLQTHTAKGITDKDFELARKIEDFVSWRPAKRAARSRGRRPATSGSPTSNMMRPNDAARFARLEMSRRFMAPHGAREFRSIVARRIERGRGRVLA